MIKDTVRKRLIIGAGAGLATAVVIGGIVSASGLKDAQLSIPEEEEEKFADEKILGYSENIVDSKDEILKLCTDFAESVCERNYKTSDGREGYHLLTAEYRKTLEEAKDAENTAAFYRDNELVQTLVGVDDVQLAEENEDGVQAILMCRTMYNEAAEGFVDRSGRTAGEEFSLMMFFGLGQEDGKWKISGFNVLQC